MRSKEFLYILLGFYLLAFPATAFGSENNEVINEKTGDSIVVYGESLSDSQKEQVKEDLEVVEGDQELTVTGQDVQNYINGNPTARLFSSAKIIPLEKGEGLTITIVNEEYITEVTTEMYANALLTAGVENAEVIIASPVKVTGHSALTGIYKAYDVKGEKLDQERMEVANEELSLLTTLAEDAGLDKEQVSRLFTNIKKEIAEQNPVSKEEVEQIVSEQLKNLNIELSEENRQLLIDLFEKIRSLDIDFEQIKSQLNDLTQKIEDILGDEGFWRSLLQGIQNFLQSITNFIKSIFG
ncbi:DUF1002 domain-containing protein [Bacillaceae bacterium S4-13-56]